MSQALTIEALITWFFVIFLSLNNQWAQKKRYRQDSILKLFTIKGGKI